MIDDAICPVINYTAVFIDANVYRSTTTHVQMDAQSAVIVFTA